MPGIEACRVSFFPPHSWYHIQHLTGHSNKLRLNCEEGSVIPWVLFLLVMGQFDLQCRPSLHVSQKKWPQIWSFSTCTSLADNYT